jgi:hypothetical protein
MLVPTRVNPLIQNTFQIPQLVPRKFLTISRPKNRLNPLKQTTGKKVEIIVKTRQNSSKLVIARQKTEKDAYLQSVGRSTFATTRTGGPPSPFVGTALAPWYPRFQRALFHRYPFTGLKTRNIVLVWSFAVASPRLPWVAGWLKAHTHWGWCRNNPSLSRHRPMPVRPPAADLPSL